MLTLRLAPACARLRLLAPACSWPAGWSPRPRQAWPGGARRGRHLHCFLRAALHPDPKELEDGRALTSEEKEAGGGRSMFISRVLLYPPISRAPSSCSLHPIPLFLWAGRPHWFNGSAKIELGAIIPIAIYQLFIFFFIFFLLASFHFL